MSMISVGASLGTTPCVMVHGSMATGRADWWPIAASLRSERKVSLVDLPGHGRHGGEIPISFVAALNWLVEFLDDLPGPVHLVGHSNGGSLALAASLQVPDKLVSLVVQGANAAVSPRLRASLGEPDVSALESRRPDLVARWQRIHQDWKALFDASYVIAKSGPSLSVNDLACVSVPTLVIEGAQDELNRDLGHGAEIAEGVRGAQLWNPNAGHDVHRELADQWAAKVAAFLRVHDRPAEVGRLATTSRRTSVLAHPVADAEQVTQVEPEEIFEIEAEIDDWSKIRLIADGYQGWIRADRIETLEVGSGLSLPSPETTPSPLDTGSALDRIVALVGTRYEWGGRGSSGIDCSGLSQRFASLCGVSLPRDSWEQFEALPPVPAPEAGHLAFFADPDSALDSPITHVGVCLDSDRMIHAYGRSNQVQVDRFEELLEGVRAPVFAGYGRLP